MHMKESPPAILELKPWKKFHRKENDPRGWQAVIESRIQNKMIICAHVARILLVCVSKPKPLHSKTRSV